MHFDFASYDYLALVIGVVLVIFGCTLMDDDVGSMFIVIGLFLVIGGGVHAAHRSRDNGQREDSIRTALHDVGFIPTAVHHHSVQWTENGCQFTFQLKQSDGNWNLLITHGNGSVSILTPAHLNHLLSDPVCQ